MLSLIFCLTIGNFNFILSTFEKQGGDTPSESFLLILKFFLDDFDLVDLGFQESPFIWNNRGESHCNI